MAVALDTVSSAVEQSGDTSLSWSHTCTGSDLCLFGISGQDAEEVVGMTYNAVSMTSVTGTDLTHSPDWDATMEMFYLQNPATGTNTMETDAVASTDTMYAVGVSFTGVVQSGDPYSDVETVDTNGASSVTFPGITTTADEMILGHVHTINFGSSTHTADGTNQTERFDNNGGWASGCTSTQTGTGTVTDHGYSADSGNRDWIGAAFNVEAAGGGGGGNAMPMAAHSYRQRRAA